LFERSATTWRALSRDLRPRLLLSALAGVVVVLGAMGVASRGRFRGVRRRLVEKSAGDKR
jgi:hypothetical protein